jgi:hypothetical protein
MSTTTVRPVAADELDKLRGLDVNVTAFTAEDGYIVVAFCRGAATILQAAGSARAHAHLVAHLLTMTPPVRALAVAPFASSFDLVKVLDLQPAPAREV